MPSVAASQVPCIASYAMTGSLARSDGPGLGEESETPGNRPVFHVAPALRDVEKPMATATLEDASGLEDRDDRRTERERIGLHLRGVLADRVARAVARDLPRDHFAVARDGVVGIRGDDVTTGPAADGVARTVAVGGNAIFAGTRVDGVAARAAEEDVGAPEAGDRVLACAPVEDIGAWSPDECVSSGRPCDGCGRCEACHERSDRVEEWTG
jgi:hypothetical protein